MRKRDHCRNKAHQEIVFEAIKASNGEDGDICLQEPLYLGPISFCNTTEDITLSGIETAHFLLFDTKDRVIRYGDIPSLALLKIHRHLVKKKNYFFKPEIQKNL